MQIDFVWRAAGSIKAALCVPPLCVLSQVRMLTFNVCDVLSSTSISAGDGGGGSRGGGSDGGGQAGGGGGGGGGGGRGGGRDGGER